MDLSRLRAIGPFFALDVGPPAGPGWAPAARLADSADAVDAWVAWGAARLGTDDRAVVASLLHQGWAARFTSILAGSLVLAGAAPDLDVAGLSYRYPAGGGALELTVTPAGAGAALPPEAAWRRLVDGNLEPVADGLRRRVRVGSRLLWGNVASAFAGSLAALDRAGHGPLARLVDAPWARPAELDGLGRWTPAAEASAGAGPPALRFRRTTCCLYERLPGAGRCGDCSLDA